MAMCVIHHGQSSHAAQQPVEADGSARHAACRRTQASRHAARGLTGALGRKVFV